MNLNKMIDHTNLKQDAVVADIERLCDEARAFDFATVCVNSCWTARAAELLHGTDIGVTTVIGFPLGAMSTAAKVAETEIAVADGATEIDMVLNVGHLKDGDDGIVERDIAAVVKAAGNAGVKVILECCLLTDDEIVRACEASVRAGAAFVKTSTGFSTGGATLEDVRLMRKTVGDRCKVKAAGGIHNRAEALAMVEAGADRLGTSSGIAIAEG
ncbi:MAG: deoxyribose-phosphate aldolase [Coriobacteriales bacterium]|nr:deoxyribose-phosphate aldolase [Coriobacteriales bacterium]